MSNNACCDHATPSLVFSRGRLHSNIVEFKGICASFFSSEYELFFPSKVAPWEPLLELFANSDLGLEVIHDREASVALRLAPSRAILSGPAKTARLVQRGLSIGGWRFISCESPQEVALVEELAVARGVQQEVLLRLKATPLRRLGMSIGDAERIVKQAPTYRGIRMAGLHVHAGSNQTAEEADLTADFIALAVERFSSAGVVPRYINFGGGLPCLDGNTDEIARRLQRFAGIARSVDARILLEPGRVLVGDAARLTARIVEVRPSDRQMTIDCAAYVMHGPCSADRYLFHKRSGEDRGYRINVVKSKSGRFRLGGIWPAEGDSVWLEDVPENCRPGDHIIFMHAGAYSLGFLNELTFDGLQPSLEEDWSTS